ncbi:MAG: hypothetical protein M1840_008500 [Geoglossum simile]|nr:MAG: hypothetical protein M1840_008500 [Geoglossum simile]
MLILPSAAKGCDLDIKCPMVLDLIHTGSSSPDSTVSRGYYDIDDFSSPLDFLKVNHDMDSKEFTDITVVDLTEDKPLAYDDLVSQYTTLLSSTCSSVKGASDDNDNEGLSDLVSDKPSLPHEIEAPPTNTVDCNPAELNAQTKPRKSGIRLRLNPPKPPMPKSPTPKILL